MRVASTLLCVSALLLTAVEAQSAQQNASGPSLLRKQEAPAPSAPNPSYLIDSGGPVLPNTTTYAIFWGNESDFPSDLLTGIDALYSGLEGSRFLGIANQYLRGARAHALRRQPLRSLGGATTVGDLPDR